MHKLLTVLAGAGATAAAWWLVRRLLVQGARSGVAPAGAGTPTETMRTNSPAPSREQLYREARRLGVRGRSKMNKRQLQEAVEAASIGARS